MPSGAPLQNRLRQYVLRPAGRKRQVSAGWGYCSSSLYRFRSFPPGSAWKPLRKCNHHRLHLNLSLKSALLASTRCLHRQMAKFLMRGSPAEYSQPCHSGPRFSAAHSDIELAVAALESCHDEIGRLNSITHAGRAPECLPKVLLTVEVHTTGAHQDQIRIFQFRFNEQRGKCVSNACLGRNAQVRGRSTRACDRILFVQVARLRPRSTNS